MTIEEIKFEKEEAERQIAEIIKEFKKKLPPGVMVTSIRPMTSHGGGTLMIIDLSL